MGTFCEQFRLPCSKRKPKPKNKTVTVCQPKKVRPPYRKPKTKPKPPPNQPDKPITCFKCGKQGHISRYYRLKQKIKNLNLDSNFEDQINNLLTETSDEDTQLSSDESGIPEDEVSSFEETSENSINVLTKEQDLLFDAINAIPDPEEKRIYLNKLKSTLEGNSSKVKPSIQTNKFSLKETLKKLEKNSAKPIRVQDLQSEIQNLKVEVKAIKEKQKIHQDIIDVLTCN